ncbi:MAG: hypothetical protein L3K19_02510 [Thermoplasmata archaeon]|nr:hypothetical protein [Thermoplasmata archaeon]
MRNASWWVGGTLAVLAVIVLLSSGPAAAPFGTSSAPGNARQASGLPGGASAAPRPHVVTHPSPIPVASAHTGLAHPLTHWWFGGYYGGATLSPTQAKMTLTIPDAVPASSEFYYVLLSTWDNAGSYDQVGISNDYGTWGWTWSYTSACAGSYTYTPNQLALQRGTTYTFTMTIASGNVTFTVAKGATVVGTIVGNSGGTSFTMSGFYTCATGGTYYDYTDYEEIYATTQSFPSFNFVFNQNVVTNGSVTNWSSFGSGAPSGILTAVRANTVRVENQGFTMRFMGAPDRVTLPAATIAYHTNVSLTWWFNAGNITLSATGVPSGMSVGFGTSGAAPPFTSNVTLRFSSVHAGTYYLSIKATGAGGVYTYLTLKVKLL